jgi:heterodisulfide reductase subunit A-like polyferredoxin
VKKAMNIAYKRIVVVGGGTAGWMAATSLATALPGSTVELVVCVGEATFPMSGPDLGKGYELLPFHKIARCSYNLYWRVGRRAVSNAPRASLIHQTQRFEQHGFCAMDLYDAPSFWRY